MLVSLLLSKNLHGPVSVTLRMLKICEVRGIAHCRIAVTASLSCRVSVFWLLILSLTNTLVFTTSIAFHFPECRRVKLASLSWQSEYLSSFHSSQLISFH